MKYEKQKVELEQSGYAITNEIFSAEEVRAIINCIEEFEGNSANSEVDSFIRTKDLFAIRQLLNHCPALSSLIFNARMKALIKELASEEFSVCKAIYFDKPKASNWFVSYHQDLSVSVTKKAEIEGYKNWTFKRGQFGVEPPTNILDNIITLRIHLDDTDENNGALKVIPNSHLNGVYKLDLIRDKIEDEQICRVKKGEVMLMKPLTFHASNRTINDQQRKVIHLEISNQNLQNPIDWKERKSIPF